MPGAQPAPPRRPYIHAPPISTGRWKALPALGPVVGDSRPRHPPRRHRRRPALRESRHLARRAVQANSVTLFSVNLLHPARCQLQQRASTCSATPRGRGTRAGSVERPAQARDHRFALVQVVVGEALVELLELPALLVSEVPRNRTLRTTRWSPRAAPSDGMPTPRSVTSVRAGFPAQFSISSSPSSVCTARASRAQRRPRSGPPRSRGRCRRARSAGRRPPRRARTVAGGPPFSRRGRGRQPDALVVAIREGCPRSACGG